MHKVLFVGRTRYSSPLSTTHAHKFAAVEQVLDYRVVGSASDNGTAPRRFRLLRRLRLCDGPLFYARLPFVLVREIRAFAPDVVVTQSPYEGSAALFARLLAGSRARVVVEVHGDWHSATRMYGSPSRAILTPVADRVAARTIKRADGVRTVSAFTRRLVRQLGVEPLASFHAYTESEVFLSSEPQPLPDVPRLAFIGVLERYKNVDGLAEAWRRAAPLLPGVTLELVGEGRRSPAVEALQADVPEQTVWHRRLPPAKIAALLDRCWALVLPSFSEGLPRVALEALARGRPVVGSRAGGIPDAVRDGVNGTLVPPGDVEALAEALVAVVRDPERTRRLSKAAKPSIEQVLVSADEYAERMAELVERAVAA